MLLPFLSPLLAACFERIRLFKVIKRCILAHGLISIIRFVWAMEFSYKMLHFTSFCPDTVAVVAMGLSMN